MNEEKSPRRFSKKTGLALVAGGLLAATAVGGGSYALWHDDESVTGKIGTSQIGFGIGEVGNVNTFSDNGSSVDYSFGKDAAADLIADGKYAHAVQIDGATNGSTGLDFTTKIPDFTADGGLFGQANTKAFFVNDPSECTTDADSTKFESVTDAARHLINPGGSDVQKKMQYLCIQANLDMSADGEYSNTGTVTGTDENGGTATADSTWNATVAKKLGDPNNEPTHTVTFDPSSVKAGA